MRVTVLFFGMLRDITGFGKEQIDVTEPACIGAVWEQYAARFSRLTILRPHLRFARNHEFVEGDAPLAAGDEIAFLPPVSGGSDDQRCAAFITRESLNSCAITRSVQQSSDGAVVTFEGVVRDNTRGRSTEFLEYEGYEEMAVKIMHDIGADLLRKHAIGRIAFAHRLGPLGIGEASVVIAVSAPHRQAAFEACSEAINRLKATVPIWKKEHFAGGEVWVEGQWDDAVSH